MAVYEQFRVADGMSSCQGGMDGGKTPNLIDRSQCAYLENLTVRGGYPTTRPGFKQITIDPRLNRSGLVGDWVIESISRYPFQGIGYYENSGTKGFFVVSSGGFSFRLDMSNSSVKVNDITVPSDPNGDVTPKVYMQQADNYMVIQDSVSIPQIFDGATSRRAGADEVPIGTGPMAYGMGRLWVAQGNEYVAGDITGGATGVLKFTENDYLNEGGSFQVPLKSGWISAMTFTASLTTATGQGELMVLTPDSVYSTVVPVDRTVWKNTTDPVQRVVLIENGSLSQESTTLVNGDVFMRSKDGIRSVVQAFRDFSQYGNIPISRELQKVLSGDSEDLLKYSSSILFDNRLLMTAGANTRRSRASGAFFDKLAVLDFDLINTMATKAPPAWDGVWTGYRFLRVVKGRFAGKERAFAVVENPNRGFVRSVLVKTGVTVTNTGGLGFGNTVPKLLSLTASLADPVQAICDTWCVFKATGATPVVGGSGYSVGDIVQLTYSNSGEISASFTVTGVSSGAVTSLALINPGLYFSTPTASPATTRLSGAGVGLTIATAFQWTGVYTTFYSVSSITPKSTSAGTGWVVGDTFKIPDISGPTVAFGTVTGVDSSGAVLSASVTSGSSGQYLLPPSGSTTGYRCTKTSGAGTDFYSDVSYYLDTYHCGEGYGPDATFSVVSKNTSSTVGFESCIVYPEMEYEWEIYEITKDYKFDYDMNGTEIPINSILETKSYSFENPNVTIRDQKKLGGAELWIDKITGNVNFNLKFRPDQYPCWQDWYSWNHNTSYKDCSTSVDCTPRTYLEQGRPRVPIPEPPAVCDAATGRTLNYGREFQARLTISGYAQLKMLELVAYQLPEENHPPCAPAVESQTGLECPCIS
jgi:hypothetical protein